jgi:hypothetical protein
MRHNRQDNDLLRAVHYVAEGELQIASQKQLIRNLRCKGRSTTQAEVILAALERSHLQMRNYLEILRELKF